mmetsp:Transcript_2110/g.3604  ORF Transcript_2110/g.3604 Transcript_2110/m.3604 type:complete len:277 (-) Transcript_2110:546-1376(-)
MVSRGFRTCVFLLVAGLQVLGSMANLATVNGLQNTALAFAPVKMGRKNLSMPRRLLSDDAEDAIGDKEDATGDAADNAEDNADDKQDTTEDNAEDREDGVDEVASDREEKEVPEKEESSDREIEDKEVPEKEEEVEDKEVPENEESSDRQIEVKNFDENFDGFADMREAAAKEARARVDDEADDDQDNDDDSSDEEDSDDGDDDKSSWSPEDYWYWFVPVGAVVMISGISYCIWKSGRSTTLANEEEAAVKAASAKAITEDGEKKTYGAVSKTEEA